MLLTQCPVCKDTLVRGADIVAAPCGHTYHEYCLREWLKTKPNCPQCRKVCQSNRVKRLYFDFVEEESFSQSGDSEVQIEKLRSSVETLRSKLSHIESVLAASESACATAVERLETTQAALRDNERKLQKERAKNDQQRIELRQHTELLQQAMLERAEVEEIRQQIATMKDVEKLVKGTASEARELFRVFEEQAESDCPQVAMRHLVKLVAVLRTELETTKAEKRELKRERHRLDKELARVRRQMADETSSAVAAKEALDQEKSHVAWLERERDSLRTKVAQMASAIRSPTADAVSSLARRVAFESPMAQPSTSTTAVPCDGDLSTVDLFESTDDLPPVAGRASVDSNYFETPSPAPQSTKCKSQKRRNPNPFAVLNQSAEEVDENEKEGPSPPLRFRVDPGHFNILRSHLLNYGISGNARSSKRADYNGLGSRQTETSIIHPPPPRLRPSPKLKRRQNMKKKMKGGTGGGRTLDQFLSSK